MFVSCAFSGKQPGGVLGSSDYLLVQSIRRELVLSNIKSLLNRKRKRCAVCPDYFIHQGFSRFVCTSMSYEACSRKKTHCDHELD